MNNLHSILVKIHVWSSAFFTIVALLLVFFAIKGLIFRNEYKKFNINLEYIYIGLLYLGLVLGITLYFFVDSNEDVSKIPIEVLQKRHSTAFWAIEHFSVMIFALLIAQIGKLFTSKAITSKDKFKYALFYYGIATCIVLASMTIYLYYKMH
ncbi:MAG: hypothetical protein P1P88_01405 [Bacteroidales bacterium]|nr:hypothetical protein [Bacteroidales bacterium]